MESAFTTAALWMALAILSTILAKHMRLSSALLEICVGAAAAFALDSIRGAGSMGADEPWLRFLAAMGAVLLTFLAGAELEPEVMRVKWKEVTVVGLVGFFAPFLGCAAVARYLLHWDTQASWLAGVALSTTSMAVVYAVMLETGFNRTEFGKGILGACFINDLGTVLALGFLFAPFTHKTLVFAIGCVLAFVLLPAVTAKLTAAYGHKTAAIRTKWIVFVLCGLGALALWSGNEAVLPAYICGMLLAGSAARDTFFIRRLRTLTVGFLTPFYFLRAGSLVSMSALIAAPAVFGLLLAGKVASKIFGLFPVIGVFRKERNERWYYTLLMSTGLTFGTISALYGFSHGIVTQQQYSFLVAAVIASAVIPTLIASLAFVPVHLLPAPESITPASPAAEANDIEEE